MRDMKLLLSALLFFCYSLQTLAGTAILSTLQVTTLAKEPERSHGDVMICEYEDDSINTYSRPLTYSIPPVFQNCPKEFIPGKDEKYANCTITNGDDPCTLLHELHRAKEFRTYFLAILPIIFSVFALILNAVYLVLVIRIYRKTNSSHRKRYLFLLSRSMSSIMALILFYVVVICWKTSGFAYYTAMIFILIGGLNFLSICGTYIALTCLLYTAVVHPFFYKTKVTIRHCYGIIAAIWVLSLGASICVGIWGATLFYPDTSPVVCSYKYCQKPLAICIVVSLTICFSSVLLIYGFLLYRLHTRYKKEHKTLSTNSQVSRQRSSMVAMNRLGMNMATFAAGSIPILVVCIVALSNLHRLSTLGEGCKSSCKTYLMSKLFVEVEILASVAALVWILAMILDPIINTIADRMIRGIVSEACKRLRQRVDSWRKPTVTESTEVPESPDENANDIK